MGRAYVTTIVNIGTADEPNMVPKIRPWMPRDPGGVRGVTSSRGMIGSDMTSGANYGRPRQAWCAAWVEVRQVDGADDSSVWAVIDADADNTYLGDLPLDEPAPTQVVQRLRQRGFLTQQEANAVTTYRLLIRTIVQKQYPYRDEYALLTGAI